MASRRNTKQLYLISQLSLRNRGLQHKRHGCEAVVISNLIIIQIKDEIDKYLKVTPTGNIAVPAYIRLGATLPRLALRKDFA